jgi:hypothetical protein
MNAARRISPSGQGPWSLIWASLAKGKKKSNTDYGAILKILLHKVPRRKRYAMRK